MNKLYLPAFNNNFIRIRFYLCCRRHYCMDALGYYLHGSFGWLICRTRSDDTQFDLDEYSWVNTSVLVERL